MFDFYSKGKRTISVTDMIPILDSIRLIDVREPYEVIHDKIGSALNIPLEILLKNPEKYLDKEKTYYFICQTDGRSGWTVQSLERLGYDAINVLGGMRAYKEFQKCNILCGL